MASSVSSDIGRGLNASRLPRNYWTILEAIRTVEPGRHLTAQEVHLRARAVQPKLGFATVHRGLTRLHELGYVLKLDVPGAASAVYEPAVSPHAHFRCTGCGAIRDVNFRVSDDAIAALAAELGLQIATESTTFAGRCAECLATAPGASPSRCADRLAAARGA